MFERFQEKDRFFTRCFSYPSCLVMVTNEGSITCKCLKWEKSRGAFALISHILYIFEIFQILLSTFSLLKNSDLIEFTKKYLTTPIWRSYEWRTSMTQYRTVTQLHNARGVLMKHIADSILSISGFLDMRVTFMRKRFKKFWSHGKTLYYR